MDSRKVTSREYKMLLRPKRFEGGEAALRLKARKFWETFSSAVSDVVIKTHGTPDEVNAQRLITFLDTSKRHLDAGRYIFRERKKPDGTKPEVTLKFRHADRHVSQDRNMSSIRGESKTKFEEDIKGPDVKKAPFVSLYSFSTTVKGLDRREFPRLKELRALFPDLGDRLDDFQGNRPLAPVGRFTVYEVVLTGGFLTIGKDPLVDAECALIVWYDHAVKVLRRPLLVEFSYRYGNDEEQYGGTMSGRAYSVFRALQTRLEAWVDPKAATKTAFVYG